MQGVKIKKIVRILLVLENTRLRDGKKFSGLKNRKFKLFWHGVYSVYFLPSRCIGISLYSTHRFTEFFRYKWHEGNPIVMYIVNCRF